MWFKIIQQLYNNTINSLSFSRKNTWVIYVPAITIISFLFYSSLGNVQTSKANIIPLEEQIKVHIEDNTVLKGFLSNVLTEVSDCKIVITKTYNRPCFNKTTVIETTRIIHLNDINVSDPYVFSDTKRYPEDFVRWNYVNSKLNCIKTVENMYERYLVEVEPSSIRNSESLSILNDLVDEKLRENFFSSKRTYLYCSNSPSIPDFSKPKIFLKNNAAKPLADLIKKYHIKKCSK